MQEKLKNLKGKPIIFASLGVLAIIAAAATFVVAQLSSNPVATVNTGVLNVREGPGLGYRVITTLPQGSDVELLGRNKDASWFQVRLASGEEGWVSSSLVLTNASVLDLPIVETVSAAPYGWVTSGFLNVRTGAGTRYPIIVTLKQDQTFEMLGRNSNGSWLLVRYQGTYVGWVNSNHVGSSMPFSQLPELNPVFVETSAPSSAVPTYGTGIAAVLELNVYEGPGVTYPVLVVLPSGTRFPLSGRDATMSWIQILLPDNRVGWVNGNSIGASIPYKDLPVVQYQPPTQSQVGSDPASDTPPADPNASPGG